MRKHVKSTGCGLSSGCVDGDGQSWIGFRRYSRSSSPLLLVARLILPPLLVIGALFLFFSTLPWCFPTPVAAQESEEAHPVRVALTSLHETLDTTDPNAQASTVLALVFEIEPGWHIYWENSGESATPTRIEWMTSNGWQVGPLQWPTPTRFIERGDITTFGYRKEAVLLAPLIAETPEAYAQGEVRVDATVKWLVCSDVCIPGKEQLSLQIPFSANGSTLSDAASTIQSTQDALPRHSLNGLSVSVATLHQALAPQSESQLVFAVQGLTFPKDAMTAAPEVQIFPGPSEKFSIGAPQVGRVGETLLISAPIKAAAGTPLQPHTLEGLLAISAAHLQGDEDTAVRWQAVVEMAADQGSPVEAVATQLAAATPLAPTQYRLVRWDDQADPASGSDAAADTATIDPLTAQQASRSIWIILLFAFIGGMILNLMPCVLPIIAIKVMGFIEQRDHGERVTRGPFWFCSGVLFSFLVLALTVIGLRSIGVQLGWGFQFQHPEFVCAIALIVFVLALGFFDLYVFALPGMQRYCSAVDRIKPSPLKHFFDGVIATILSTPCTAPFLGTALVFAFTQGPAYTLAIHIAIGLGLALPYFVLATNPKLLALLPRPGNWMHRMRQLMGFMLLATVLWLLFVLQKLTGEGVIWCLLLMLSLVFSIWIYDWSRDWQVAATPSGRKPLLSKKRVVRFLVAAGLVISTLLLYPKATTRVSGLTTASAEKHGVTWVPFSAAEVEAALAAGQPVFIDFTADWCITCKANEFLIINTAPVAKALLEHKVVPMIADWTNGDEEITKALAQYGGRGVPLYVVLSPQEGAVPVVLSTIPSRSALIEALREAAE